MKTEHRNGLTAVSASSGEIDRVEIAQLSGLTMGQWQEKHKPDLMINASLWDGKGAIGTIWQDGTLTRNEGTGFGFGVNKAGDWGFADPWSVDWQDYITGHPALVQGGKALPYSVGQDIMTARTKRSVAAVAGDRLYLITADSMTIAQLRAALVDFGVYHAINLDGGGSSRLMVGGKAVNGPTDNRKCPNAIAIWLKKEDKPIKIAIDAGHGKHTAGKRCLKSLDPTETREWVLNSRIAGYVENGLRVAGIDTVRVDDASGEVDVGLSVRTDKANRGGADAYISIHHDAGINGGTGGGVTVFCHPAASGKAFELRDKIYDSVVEHGKLQGNRSSPKQTADYQVLRQTKMPAVLIECGFMDSKTDVPIILSDQYARDCARGIVEGVCASFGVEVTTIPAEQPEVRHWAQEAYDSLIAKGAAIHETRFDDNITRGEVFALLDQIK